MTTSRGALTAVALSGGVDSAVAAARLVRDGQPVVGITLQTWPSLRSAEGERLDRCCSPAAARDARRVAELLGIPYYLLNYEAEFDREVVERFVETYRAGETPNPCVACNAQLKFGSLLTRARGWGALRVATGHYAQVRQDPSTGRWLLRRGGDPRKDQSYFLYSLTQEQLAAAVFPVGHLHKEETRRLARDWGLPVAEKPDSQEICFVARDYRTYLRQRCPDAALPGVIRDTRGAVRGQHQGVAFYTVGQRRGLKIGSTSPLYVVDVDAQRNEVIVGQEAELLASRVELTAVNLIVTATLPGPRRVLAKVRYAQAAVPATLTPLDSGGASLTFDAPLRAPAPGQAAVCYDAEDPELVVGGGTIRRPPRRGC